jgi:adenylate cyclase
MATTRRLAAILAVDVAGYSRLMGVDEEGTHERLRAHFSELVHPKITECRGRVVKNTGDGLLAEFASIVDALRCAVAVQRGMAERNSTTPADRRIEFRVGINLGDVIVEDDDIFGDGVNVAARLEALADPGGICVSRIVRDQVRDKLDFVFEGLGEQYVKNIARPIPVYRVSLRMAAAAVQTEIAPSQTLAVPDKPSVAVLPFANMSADPEQEFFADGIAEDIITALSRYPSLFVIARNSCFTYKGRAVDVKQVGRELGVRYVLEGSLRKAGNRIRVTAQLVEAENGKHIWAERYDRDLADIFAIQDEITEAVTIAVGAAIADIELHRAIRKPPESLDAWAAYQRGLWHLGKTTANDCELAENFFRQAINLDRNFSDGYCGLAMAQMRAAGTFRTHDLAEAQNSGERLARMAIALDRGNAFTHSCLSFALFMRGDHHGALAEADLAIMLSPNLATGYFQKGTSLIYSGQPQEGLIALQTSLRLEPRGPNWSTILHHLVIGLYFSRAYHDAVEAARHLIRSFPEYPSSYRWLAAALGQLGCTGEAKEALRKGMTIVGASFRPVIEPRPLWQRPEDYAHLLEGLRKAGLPEE